jgi:hypothetical protein
VSPECGDASLEEALARWLVVFATSTTRDVLEGFPTFASTCRC